LAFFEKHNSWTRRQQYELLSPDVDFQTRDILCNEGKDWISIRRKFSQKQISVFVYKKENKLLSLCWKFSSFFPSVFLWQSTIVAHFCYTVENVSTVLTLTNIRDLIKTHTHTHHFLCKNIFISISMWDIKASFR